MTRRRVSTQRTATLPCPRALSDGWCEADVDVALGYEPPDPSLGIRGGYAVEDVPDRCADGHTFTRAELATLETQATQAARNATLDREFDA